MSAVECHRPSHYLHQTNARYSLRQFCTCIGGRCRRVVQNLDLQDFRVVEGLFDRFRGGFRDTVFTDVCSGLLVMCQRAEMSTLS